MKIENKKDSLLLEITPDEFDMLNMALRSLCSDEWFACYWEEARNFRKEMVKKGNEMMKTASYSSPSFIVPDRSKELLERLKK